MNFTNPYACEENIWAAISELQSLAFRLFKWFESNNMKASPGKSHTLQSNKKTEKVTISNVVLTSRVEQKLLGFNLDSEFKSEKRITGICNKASQKNMFCLELQATCH